MRIAYVVPYVPSLVRTRSYNLIAHLTSLGHEVAVFTLGSSKQDLIDAHAFRDKCSELHYASQPLWRPVWNMAASIPSNAPLQAAYSWQRGMALRISQHVSQKDFDIVQVEHLRGSRYGVFLKSRITTVPVIWDSVDCISHLFEQAATHSRTPFGKLVTRFELPRTQQAERDLVSKFDHVLVTSPVDRDALLGLTPAAKGQPHVSVLPNGVDLDYFHPNGGVQRDPAAIVFSGKMSYHANVTMAQYLATEIMPRVWRNRPAAHLYIVGKSPSSAVRALGKNPQITVTGTVDDIRPFLWRAAVSVAPLLYGAGIQNKILEAMASGTPVVSSCKALGALRVHPGRELLASDDTNGLADAILQVLEKPDLQSRLREAGMAYVRSFHNWSQIASDLADVYQQVLPSKKSPC